MPVVTVYSEDESNPGDYFAQFSCRNKAFSPPRLKLQLSVWGENSFAAE